MQKCQKRLLNKPFKEKKRPHDTSRPDQDVVVCVCASCCVDGTVFSLAKVKRRVRGCCNLNILTRVRGKRRLRISVPSSPATLGPVGLLTFAHAGSAGTSRWMVCRCFLGWSASNHELESAQRGRAAPRVGGAALRRCAAGNAPLGACRRQRSRERDTRKVHRQCFLTLLGVQTGQRRLFAR